MKMNLYYGQVVSVSDKDKKSKIQVRLLPELRDAPEGALPWVRPFLGRSYGEGEDSQNLPGVGTFAWLVFTDDYFQDGYYLSGVAVDSAKDFSAVQDLISSIPEADAVAADSTRFERYADGTLFFHSAKTGEYGLLHGTGSYTLFAKDGSVTTFGNKSVRLYNEKVSLELTDSGEFKVIGDSGASYDTSELKYDGDYLVKFSVFQSIISNILTNLSTRMYGDPLSGSTMPVMAPFDLSVLFPTMGTADLASAKTSKTP